MAFYHKLAMHDYFASRGAGARQATKLERIREAGVMDERVASAIQKLRTQGALSLEEKKQRFQRPIRDIGIERERFDLGLARRFSPGLLLAKTREAGIYSDYLEQKLKELGLGGAESRLPVTGDIPSHGTERPGKLGSWMETGPSRVLGTKRLTPIPAPMDQLRLSEDMFNMPESRRKILDELRTRPRPYRR